MAERVGRSKKDSTRVLGGSYKVPTGKKASKSLRGVSGQAAYQRNFYARAGHVDSAAHAKRGGQHLNRELGFAALAIGSGSLAAHTGHTAAAGVAIGALGGQMYHDSKYRKQLNKRSGTKPSALYGFHTSKKKKGK